VSAVVYLQEEWDFGGLENRPSEWVAQLAQFRRAYREEREGTLVADDHEPSGEGAEADGKN
jgi:hypothetical protein